MRLPVVFGLNSLKEDTLVRVDRDLVSGVSGGGDLELLDQIGHEPFGVGTLSEPEVTLAWHDDLVGWSLDLSNEGGSLLLGANMIVFTNKEGHG